jgi:outer membrane protein
MLAGSMRISLTNTLKASLLWALASLAVAEPDAAAQAAAAATPPGVAAPERHWRLGVALGYGERTNPLIQSEKIPVLVDLDIAWFGERWFFDNGDLGFAVLDRPAFTVNAVARVNTDRAFFSKTNTRYINFRYLAAGDTALAPAAQAQAFKPPKRDYAIELGFETLFDGEWGAAALHAFHDVSGTHDGFEVGVDYNYRVTRGRFSIAPSVGVEYKSRALNDYYWGVHADEAGINLAEYHVDAGFGWQAGLRANYYLTKRLRIAASANYERLQKSVAESPLVESDYVLGYFTGLAWTF